MACKTGLDRNRADESDESLSTTREWFKIWLDAFGGERSGMWRPPGQGDDVAIPYTLVEQGIGPFRIPTASGAANSHTPRYDILGAVTAPADLDRMMKDLSVAMLVFDFLPGNSKLLRAMHSGRPTPLHHIEFCENAPYVDCQGNWDSYWASRGKKTREDWGRHERKLLKRGAEMILLQQWQDVEPVLSSVFAIEASGWKGEQGSAIRQSEDTLKFYTNLIRHWAERSQLRLFLLRVDGVDVAFQLCGLRNGVLSSLKIGYLHEYVKDSPGQVLQMQILRWAFGQPGVSLFDMLGPRTDAKLKWATGGEDLYTLQVFRRSLLGLLARLRYDWAPKLKAALRQRNAPHPERR